jgi:hypothetical protein
MIPKEIDITLVDRYPGTWVEIPRDAEEDPFFKRKREEAIKALTECPPPDFILKRMRGE